MKTETIKTIIIVILIIAMIWFFLGLYKERSYNKGISDGQISVIIEQTQTGNIFIMNNETVESYPIEVLCGGGE